MRLNDAAAKDVCLLTEKELKKLNRQELLEVLLAQSKKIDRLQEQLKETKEKLAEKELKISEAGSIAQASLVLNNIFADAQKAADQYLENIRLMHDRAKAEFESDASEPADENAAETAEVSEADVNASVPDDGDIQAERLNAAAARAAAEADRKSAAAYLAEIQSLKEQTEADCAEKKKRTDKQIRISLIRTKKAVRQMMKLYADEVTRRMKRLQEWDRQMEALHERKIEKQSSKSQ